MIRGRKRPVTYDRAMENTVEIIVNGTPRRVREGSTLAGLIEEMGLGKMACAAEVNRELVRKVERGGRVMREGDVVEVVTLVGGG